MYITKVDVHLLEKKLNYEMRISRGGFSVRRHAVVQIHTSNGLLGFGEGIGDAKRIVALLESGLCDVIVGSDPLNISLIISKLERDNVYFESMGSFTSAISAIEMACLDIKSKHTNLSISNLLGGKVHDKFEAYASDVYWDKDAEKMAENALRIKNLGFRAIKVHVGVESPILEFSRIKRIRDAIGFDVKLMLDLNAGYTLTESLEAFKIWSEFQPYWIEEPLIISSIDSIKMLSNKTNIVIAQGENIVGLNSYKNILDTGSTQVLMPDIGRVGGVYETIKIYNLAYSYGFSVSPHNFSSGILLNFTMQVMASQKNSLLLELDTSDNAVYEEFLSEPLKLKDGMVVIPDSVGIDSDKSMAAIKKYKVN